MRTDVLRSPYAQHIHRKIYGKQGGEFLDKKQADHIVSLDMTLSILKTKPGPKNKA